MPPQFEHNVRPVSNPGPDNFISQKPPRKHTRLVLLVVLLVFVGVMAIAYFWFSLTLIGPGSVDIKTPQPITNEFADWKTYRNEEYGFEIKYPSPFIEPGAGSKDIDFTYWSEKYTSSITGFSIYPTKNSEKMSLDDYFKKNVDRTGSLIREKDFVFKILPGGGEMYFLEERNLPLANEYFDSDQGPVCSYFIMSPNRDYVFIALCPGEDNGNLDDIFGPNATNNLGRQILSTFKFTK